MLIYFAASWDREKVVALHANFIFGVKGKEEKLKGVLAQCREPSHRPVGSANTLQRAVGKLLQCGAIQLLPFTRSFPRRLGRVVSRQLWEVWRENV